MKQLPEFKELNQKEILSINETAKLIGISRSTIYRLLKAKELPAQKLGKRTFIKRSDIDRLLENNSYE